MTDLVQNDPVAAIAENSATGQTAEIFADIRQTLNVEVVNLIWRHLATLPGGLEWAWTSLKPLYRDSAVASAANLRASLPLPRVPAISHNTLRAIGLDADAIAVIRVVLNSYQHTNALALVCFSAFLARFGEDMAIPRQTTPVVSADTTSRKLPSRAPLPRLIPLFEMPAALANLVQELNGFGEDTDFTLTASMYRHLAHWPIYLALVRTLLVPLHESGELKSLVAATRRLGQDAGEQLAHRISATRPGQPAEPVLAAVQRFVQHPLARMTGLCSLIRYATPD